MLFIALIALVWLMITALVVGACWAAARDPGVKCSQEREEHASAGGLGAISSARRSD